MEMDLNLQPSHELANRSRLSILLIEGGVEALTYILVEQLLRNALELKKDHLKSKIDQQTFDALYPCSGRLPRFEDMDNIILTDIIIKELLVISYTGLNNTKEENVKIIVNYIKEKLLTQHLADKKSLLLENHKHLGREQRDILYPKTTSVDINRFDITLLALIVCNTFGLKPTSGKWKDEPSGGDISIADDIARLRRHRNGLCHSSTPGISETDFNNKWADITCILLRLLGPSYRNKIEKLKTASLDPALDRQCQKIMTEWYEQDTDIKDHIEKYAKMALKVNEVSKRVNDLETKLHRKLPTDSMVDLVKHWKEKEDVLFHKTRAAQEVEIKIDRQNIVTITGTTGSGKSFIAKHIALQYQRQGYDIYPLLNPSEIDQFYCIDKKQLFMFEDPVGVQLLDDESVSNWKHCSERLMSVFKISNQKLLITMRLHLTNEITLRNKQCLFTDSEINITNQNFKLDRMVKIRMFKSHCKEDVPPKGIMFCSFDCFPLLCQVYNASDKKNDIFADPFPELMRQFHDISEKNEMQFKALVLCSVMDECCEDLFDPFQNNESLQSDRKRMNAVLSALGLDSYSSSEIKMQLDIICGVFLHKINGTYKFIHTLFKESVAFCMGRKSTGFIFQYFTRQLMHKRVRIGNRLPSDENEDLLILLPDNEKHQKMMRDRIIKDLIKKYFCSVFMNPYVTSNYIEEYICRTIKSDNFEINNLDNFSKTVLHWAALTGNETLTKCILDTEVDIDHQDMLGATALVDASCNGNFNEMRLLLNRKANPNLSDIFGHNSLTRTICNSNLEMLRLLLDAGADANNAASPHNSPLLLSVQRSEIEMVRLLLHRNAEINVPLNEHRSALYFAALNNNTEMVELLIDKGANLNDNEEGLTALILSAEHNNIAMASLLISAGVDINTKRKDEDTTLVAAIRTNSIEMVKFLLKRGAYVNSKGRIARQLWEDVYQTFLRFSENVFENKSKTSDEQIIMKLICIEFIQEFLKQFLEPYGTGKDKDLTSFVYVLQRCLSQIPNINSTSYTTILESSQLQWDMQELYNPEFVKFIHNSVIISALDTALNDQSLDIALDGMHSALQKLKVELAQVLPALAVAVHAGNVDIVELLLRHGAKPTSDGNTPLDFAALTNNEEIVTLVRNSADVD